MAINLISGRDILFKIAEDSDAIKSAFVTAAGSTTSVTCASVTSPANTYQYAIGRILGKGDCVISSHTSAGVFTVATLDSSPAAGDVFQWAWWTGNRVGDSLSAMNESIRYSWPFWYRERKTNTTITGTVAKNGTTTVTGTSTLFLSELNIGDYITIPGTADETRLISAIASNTSLTVSSTFANTASGQTCTIASNVTLAAGTYLYDLPPACDALLAIGIQPTGKPVEWLDWGDESSMYWSVEGQRGGYKLRFHQHFSREGAIPDVYTTSNLILWYATREPELTTLTTDSCQLPVDYFVVGAAVMAIRNLQTASRVDLVTSNVAVPQLQDQARLVLQSLGVGKRPPNRVINPNAGIPDEQMALVRTIQGDTSTRNKRVPMQQK